MKLCELIEQLEMCVESGFDKDTEVILSYGTVVNSVQYMIDEETGKEYIVLSETEE